MSSRSRGKAAKAVTDLKSAEVHHADGPTIPPALLPELRESFAAVGAARKAVAEHNARGQALQRELHRSATVYLYVVGKLKAQVKVRDEDSLDLKRGVVRVAVSPSSRSS